MTDEQPNTLTNRLEERIAQGLSEEKQLLKKLRDLLIKQDFADETIEHVSGLINSMEELFLLVIVGEVKAGKSTFINSLLNDDVCKVGAIPTTDRINVLKYGPIEKERIVEEFLIEKEVPCEPLKTLHIVDTPGTNSIVKRHAEITEGFIPRCDLILFTTCVDRPFSESERQFMEYIVERWAKKIVFVITKKDIKEPHELIEIDDFVRDSIKKHFDIDPKIFMVSAKEARKAKADGDDALYDFSGFKALEEYLFESLSHSEKLALKLESPINSAIAISDRTVDEFQSRADHLKDDKKVLENIKGQLEQSESDMSENFGRFILQIDNTIYEMEKRGRNWIDDNVKLTNIGMLRSAERFRARFKDEVIKDYEIKIDDILSKAVDWFMKKYLKVWQDTTEYFADQAARRDHDGMVGKVSSKFEYNREKIYDLVRADAKDKINGFDVETMMRSFMGKASTGINAAMGGGLIGVGGGIATVALTTAAGFTWIDFTGITAGLAILGGGLFVLPMQRRKMKAAFSDKVTGLKAQLAEVLDKQIKNEARDAVEKIRDSFGPFFDYVSRNTGSVDESIKTVKEVRDGLAELKRQFGMTLKEESEATKILDDQERATSEPAMKPVEEQPEEPADDTGFDATAATDAVKPETDEEPAPEQTSDSGEE